MVGVIGEQDGVGAAGDAERLVVGNVDVSQPRAGGLVAIAVIGEVKVLEKFATVRD